MRAPPSSGVCRNKDRALWRMKIKNPDVKFVRAEKTEDVVTNVIRVTELLQNHGLELNNQRQTVKGVEIFPQMTFSPKSYITGEVEEDPSTMVIHQFSGSWL